MKRLLACVASLALIVPLLAALSPATRADAAAAATAALFDPGNIISDANMYDGGAYSAGQIQSFLEQRVTSCVAGYTCLRDYRQSTPSMPASTLCTGAYAGSPSERASDIIAKVGAACSISQKVLLVLLEKEQSLVSHRSPSASRYASATGFSCPDTAPCDPAFAGFFYQVYYAARQFQNYAKNPGSWNYQAGRVNSILYNPNGACGRGNVYIQNKATAGLYIYTPYQPNAAALANLYGTGDSCSSYGNRNFWRIYSDWFGNPTTASSLLRTVENSSVYLVSGNFKYPISSLAILASLAPLGQVGYVSQSYLDALTTSHNVGRSLRAPDGTIYFYDAGKKLPFTSCTQAADYGASCDPSGYVQLTDSQIAAFVTGPVLTSVMGTVEGARYYVKDGVKREILDDQSQLELGIPLGMNVLSENAVAHLPLGPAIARDGVFVLTRGTSSYSLISGGVRHPVAAGNEGALGVPQRTSGSLSAASLATFTQSDRTFTGVIAAAEDPSQVSIIASNGTRYEVTAGGLSADSAVPLPATLLASYPATATIGAGSFIKSPNDASVYIVMPTDIRPISSWDALLALTTDRNPIIVVMAQSLVDEMTRGPVALIAGTLVRSPGNATVYFIDGVSGRTALSDFIYPGEAGFNRLLFTNDFNINGYPESSRVMTFGFGCGSDRYVAAGGQVHLVAPELWPLYPFDFVPYDAFTCQNLKIGVPAGSFIRTPDGSIYQLVDGQKRPIVSMQRFTELSQGQTWLNVVPKFAGAIPTGPLA